MLRLSGSHFADHLAVCAGIIQLLPELPTKVREDFTNTLKVPIRAFSSVHNSATFPMLLLKSSKKVVILNEISSK